MNAMDPTFSCLKNMYLRDIPMAFKYSVAFRSPTSNRPWRESLATRPIRLQSRCLRLSIAVTGDFVEAGLILLGDLSKLAIGTPYSFANDKMLFRHKGPFQRDHLLGMTGG